jgi:hypothetical protein
LLQEKWKETFSVVTHFEIESFPRFPKIAVMSNTKVFAQLMAFGHREVFHRCVEKYDGDVGCRGFSCHDQWLAMAFGQLTYRDSLRDIVTGLEARTPLLYQMGFRSRVTKSTLADANESRDWRIYADWAQTLIAKARRLYAQEDFGIELTQTVYALDATVIDLCLSVFPWAHFRSTKAAIKLHTLLDLRGSIPSFMVITDGLVHEVNIIDELPIESGAIYIMDRGYTDYQRLHRFHSEGAFFVIRAKSNLKFRVVESRPVDKESGLRCDQTIRFQGAQARKDYPDTLRRVRFYDAEQKRSLVFLTNHFHLSALTIANLYRCRWQVELFFRWIKQHLRIHKFVGTSQNAVRLQIWVAISAYLLVAIAKKELGLKASLHEILQIISLTAFEKVTLQELFTKHTAPFGMIDDPNDTLNLFFDR